MTKREVLKLVGISRKILPKTTRKKIFSIKDIDEKIKLYKHSIKTNLEIRLHDFEKGLGGVDKKKDSFHLFAKVNLLKAKIKYFLISYDRDSFKGVYRLIRDIERGFKKL